MNKIRMAFVITSMAGVSIGIHAASSTVTFGDFSDTSNLKLNGSAAAVNSPTDGKVLRLTPAVGNQSGSAFLLNTVQLQDNASFSSFFTFRLSSPGGISDEDGTGADGIVFTLQPNSNDVGGIGGGIGFAGIPKSFGIEFDTYNNTEISGNHVGIDINGDVASVKNVHVPKRMNDGDLWYAWVDYDGTTDDLEVRLAEDSTRPAVALLEHSLDIEAILGTDLAFAGFTAGTGGAWGDQDITSWQFKNDFEPISGPITPPASAPDGGGTLALLAIAAGAMVVKRK